MPTVGRVRVVALRARRSSATSPLAGHVDAEVGDLARRLEAVALEQERVGEEAQQLLDVVDVAVAQVLAGLRDRARGRERQRRSSRRRAAASPPSASSAIPRSAAALAQQVEAPRASRGGRRGSRHSTTRAPSSTSSIERVVVERAAGVRAAHLREAVGQPLDGRGGREDLGVGGRHEAQHGRTSVWMVGRSAGTPPSIRAVRRPVSRWSATRSPSTSRRRSRAAANEPRARRRSAARAQRRRARAARGGTRRARARRARRCRASRRRGSRRARRRRRPAAPRRRGAATRPWRIS